MNFLILSCKTGGGHNAAGFALRKRLKELGHEAVVFDYLTLAGNKVSDTVGNTYIQIVKNAPDIFGAVYKVGMFVSKRTNHSPVYYANTKMGKYLKEFLQNHSFDAIIMPHLYPAETLSYLKKKRVLLPPTIAVMTDYTCIPFWEETCCDYYILPHEELKGECIRRGIPEEKLVPIGIPVDMAFAEHIEKNKAREQLKLPDSRRIHLIMAGSMGAGKLEKLTACVWKYNQKKDLVIVICGNNEKMFQRLTKKYHGVEEVRIYKFSDNIPLLMKACDILYTKPGGLTSTEAAVSKIPLVLTDPIPGCETENLNFFVKHKMALTAKSTSGQARAGVQLLGSESAKRQMAAAQEHIIDGMADKKIAEFILEKCEKMGK